MAQYDLSELIGLELEEARARLARAGLQVQMVTETQPPHPPKLVGAFRVVRARASLEGAVDLVVSREGYVPPLTPQ